MITAMVVTIENRARTNSNAAILLRERAAFDVAEPEVDGFGEIRDIHCAAEDALKNLIQGGAALSVSELRAKCAVLA
jgi:hypothetical protein